MIAELLGKGAHNAIAGRELCDLLRINGRQLTALIEKERRDGLPICANCDNQRPGYFLAENREEMQAYCDKLRHRAGEIFATRAACLKSMKALPEKTMQ